MIDLLLQIGGLLGTLILLGLSSAIDAAADSISRRRLNSLLDSGMGQRRIVERIFEEPYRFRSAVLILNAICLITATVITVIMTVGQPITIRVAALMTLLLVIILFGMALPKSLVLQNGEAAARVLVGPAAIVVALIWPFARLINALLVPILGLFGIRDLPAGPLVTEEELRMLVNVGEEEGLIEKTEREMIEGIFTFDDTAVREIMVPRVDVVGLDERSSLDEVLGAIISGGHSRIPVFCETIDDIRGILHAKDLLPWMRRGLNELPLGGLMRPAHFVPDTMKIDSLLRDMQLRNMQLAIVVDEYGGTAGLVTFEDVIEEIVGEIRDEFDSEGPPVRALPDGDLIVNARVLVDDLNTFTGMSLSSEESDRVGGIVFEQLGRVPTVGDQVNPLPGVTITVLAMEGLRPQQLRVRYLARPEHDIDAPASMDTATEER